MDAKPRLTEAELQAMTATLAASRDLASLEQERLVADCLAYRKALESIRDHWANSYDHPYCNMEQYRGSYGTGVVDGHRACTIIALTALEGEK